MRGVADEDKRNKSRQFQFKVGEIMNKKGFVLMETIVVIVVVSVALLTIFSSYNKIL